MLQKNKAEPSLRYDPATFYNHACFYHIKYVAPKVAAATDELLVVAATIDNKWKSRNFRQAIQEAVEATSRSGIIQVGMWPAGTDPCLQVADYCSWAIQRKWERGDTRSYDAIKGKIRSEYDFFAGGSVIYY